MSSPSIAATTEPVAPLPPRPPGVPLLGNIPQVKQLGMLPFMAKTWEQLGDTFAMDVGFRAVVVAHPDGIKRVLAGNAKNYVKGKVYDGVRRIIGNGVLALEGDAWKARRQLMQPAFHRNALGGLTQAMVETGAMHFDGLLAEHGSAPFVLDAHRDMVKLTLDVVTAALFGRELLGEVEISYEALRDALELVSNKGNGLVLPRWVPLPKNKKFHRTMDEVEGAIYRVIAAGRSRQPDGTLLSMLMHSVDSDTKQPLRDVDLRDEIFTMFVAGHETTALTLTWLFTLLEGRDDVMQKMVHEVETVLGDRDPIFEDFPKLPYLRQVIDETLRLRGPVAMNARTAVEDDEIQGFRIRKGEIVMPFFYGAHRHRDFWTDPEAFEPERFTAERSAGRNSWSYVPFAAGQRQCIGNMFSLVETVVLLAQLLRRFEVKVMPGAKDAKPVAMVTVRPDREIMISLQSRK